MRLVASDLDGTVVRPDGTISERTLRAFARCRDLGVDVVFVTGRPPRWMRPIAAITGHHGVAICGNGAVVYDLGTERVHSARTLSRSGALSAVRALRSVFPEAAFAVETTDGYSREPGYRPRMLPVGVQPGADGRTSAEPVVDPFEVPIAPVEELLAADALVLKLLCRVEASTADPMLAQARRVLTGIAEPVHSNAADCMIEIAAPGVSKASTLALLAGERGIDPAEVVAFGDMPNDVPMLQWAGRGIAMADGHPETLAAADQIAPPCEQDGVAQILEQLLELRPADR